MLTLSCVRSSGQQSNESEWDWVETEADIRNRARRYSSADVDDSAYYGIKGIRRQSNSVVAGACCVLILVGFGYFYLGFK